MCRCQYSEFGCSHRDLLRPLSQHEEACPERTLQCPPPNGCGERVQLRAYHEHAVKQGCSVEMRSQHTKFNLSKGWMQWDGLSLRKGEASYIVAIVVFIYTFLPQERNST